MLASDINNENVSKSFLILNVGDVNDCAPAFESETIDVEVYENNLLDSLIQVKVIDF